jgi:RNA polymerase sigma-70 factor (ECF subfamily)
MERVDAGRDLDQQRAEHDVLFRTHYEGVVAYLVCRMPVEDAKDLAVDVFLEAWRQRDHVVVDEERGWLPWLFTVARRQAASWSLARRGSASREFRFATSAEASDGDFVERIVDVEAANQRLVAALDALRQLGHNDREVLELCGLFHFTPAQAAITLGLSEGTTRVRLHRARQRLAAVVDREEAP